ncbi:MAG: hypothetical protein HGA75_17180, partial [Thiobacillus sp.]|nr:hypothetical protein [Thiobacillus sp.]
GLSPEGTVDVRWSRFSLWAHATDDLQSGGLKWTGVLGGGLGALRTDWSALAWANLDLHVGRFISGVGSSVDLEAIEPSGASAYVGYDDGCSALRVTAGFAPDRALPDVGLKVEWRK